MCKVDIEHFLRQHFVGKQFAHDPDAPDHYAVFTDGTAVYAINSESGENCPMNMRHLADAGVIERAWHEEEYVESYHSDTYTQRLYVQFEGDSAPLPLHVPDRRNDRYSVYAAHSIECDRLN